MASRSERRARRETTIAVIVETCKNLNGRARDEVKKELGLDLLGDDEQDRVRLKHTQLVLAHIAEISKATPQQKDLHEEALKIYQAS